MIPDGVLRAFRSSGTWAGALLLAALVAAVAVLALQSRSARAGDALLRIGYGPWLAAETLDYAAAEGMFERRGVAVELRRFQNSADAERAFRRGRIDLLVTPLASWMDGPADGEDALLVAACALSDGAHGLVAWTSALAAPDGARLRVAVPRGAEPALDEALAQRGLARERVDAIAVAPGKDDVALERLQARELDGALLGEPALGRALAACPGAELVGATRADDTLAIDVLLARADTLARRRADVALVLATWYDLTEVLAKTPESVARRLDPLLGLAPGDLERSLRRLRLPDAAENQALLAEGGRLDAAIAALVERLGARATAPAIERGLTAEAAAP